MFRWERVDKIEGVLKLRQSQSCGDRKKTVARVLRMCNRNPWVYSTVDRLSSKARVEISSCTLHDAGLANSTVFLGSRPSLWTALTFLFYNLWSLAPHRSSSLHLSLPSSVKMLRHILVPFTGTIDQSASGSIRGVLGFSIVTGSTDGDRGFLRSYIRRLSVIVWQAQG